MSFQTNYNIYQQDGWPGQLARANEPYAYHTGLVHVPTNGRKPRPGDAVYYDATQNSFALPTNDAQSQQAIGIVSYDPPTVQSSLSTVPDGANSDSYIEYANDSVVKIAVLGTFFVVAGEAVEYDQLVQWDRTNQDWRVVANNPPNVSGGSVSALVTSVNAAFDALRRTPVTVVSPEPVAANGIVEVRIGWGRSV